MGEFTWPFLACMLAIFLFVDSPKECAAEIAGRLDQIEAMIGASK